MRFSKKVIITVLILNVLFTSAVLVVSWHTLQQLDSLVMGWFAFTTGEVWTLGRIERDKIGRNEDVEYKQGVTNNEMF